MTVGEIGAYGRNFERFRCLRWFQYEHTHTVWPSAEGNKLEPRQLVQRVDSTKGQVERRV